MIFRHTITRLRGTQVDDGFGGVETDWTDPVATDLSGWAVDAGDTFEDVQHRDGVAVQYTLRGPFDVDIQATDRVSLFGETFIIDGGVLRQPGPSPVTSHTIIRLQRWEG